MELVVTLIASDTLEPALAAQVVGALNARCAERLDARATDIFIDGEIHPTRRIVERTLADAPVDFVVQPRADRRKQLLLSDMDSTLIEQECIDELAAELGLKARVSAITERAMRGELDFESALTSRVALLKGIGESAIDKILQSAITLTPGAAAMTRTLKANGIRTVLVSGGFTQFAGPIAERLGMDAH
ncbi:MAG: HAD-IB family phosphatase, partial [Pseudomonadota bacterium]